MLPRSLVCLRLFECEWPIGWMKGAELPNLRSLYVDHIARIDNNELNDFFKLASVESLHLGYLGDVNSEGIKCLAENMTQLTSLALCDLNIDDLTVHHICLNLKHLNSLKVTESKISDAAVDNMFVSLRELLDLDVSNNTNLTWSIIAMSEKSKSLQNLVYCLDPKLINKDVLNDIRNSVIKKFPGRYCNTFIR